MSDYPLLPPAPPDCNSSASTRDEGLAGVLRRGDLLVVALGLTLLVAGWLVRSGQIDRTKIHRFEGMTLATPASWMSLPGRSSRRQVLTDLLVTDAFKPRVVLSVERLPDGFKPQELSSYIELNLQQGLELFHLVRSRPLKLGAHQAMRLDYSHAVNPAARPDDPAATDVPVAVRASTLAVLAGGKLLRVEVKQSVSQHRVAPGLADAVLASVRVGGKP